MKPQNSRIAIGPELKHDEPMWRYCALSDLLMLLQGRVFIPSLKTLRRDDPTESRYMHRGFWSHKAHALPNDDREWLSENAKEDEKQELHNRASWPPVFGAIWDREMERRRCAWSWYGAEIESMAQWHVYAKDGVAILSRPERIQRAFATHQGLLRRIEYLRPGLDEIEASRRPYLHKKLCYSHEKEIRLVLPVDRLSEDEPGIKLDVDPRELIERIEISPLLVKDRAQELRQSLHRIVNWFSGDERSEKTKILVRVSDAKLSGGYIAEYFGHTFARQTKAPYYGLEGLPAIMKDDILK